MALDTARKRYSAMHTMCPWRGSATLPSGTVDQRERQSAAFLYSGILATVPTAVIYHGKPIAIARVNDVIGLSRAQDAVTFRRDNA